MKRFCFLVTLLLLVCCKNSNDENPLNRLAHLDTKLSVPKSGEWMSEHKELGQSFEKYTKINPVSISNRQKVIYIQPIGSFTSKQNEMVVKTVEYVGLFFQLETKLLPIISLENISSNKKRLNEGNEQLDASFIINDVLPKKIPNDGIVIMAITASDLYPNKNWNYVFGLASYKMRTGISSFNRFLTNDDYELCLNRITKTAVHEIGHMFSINHCKHAVCLMNGVNHILESDTKPNALCSQCLMKLSWNLKYNDVERLKGLICFLNENHLQNDALLLQKQLDVLK